MCIIYMYITHLTRKSQKMSEEPMNVELDLKMDEEVEKSIASDLESEDNGEIIEFLRKNQEQSSPELQV